MVSSIRNRLIHSTVIAAFAGFVLAAAPAARASETPAKTPEIVLPGTFTGAYLAGRIAEADKDRDAAARLFTQALALSTDNRPVQQSLMLALVSKGDIAGALGLAEELKDEPDIDRIARLVIGVNAMKNRQYKEAVNAFMLDAPSDLDLLITQTMAAWADLGAGDLAGALKRVEALDGPPWFRPFKEMHVAMLADAGGDDARAASAYAAAFKNEEALGTAPDAFLNFIEAYARFLARNGENARAFEVIQRGEDIAPNRPMFDELRAAVKDGTPLLPLFTTPGQGAAEVLFSISMAINREGAEDFVERYLRLALELSPERDLILYELGRLAERSGRLDDSVAFFGAVPEASPLHRLAYMQQALSLTDLDRKEEAKTLLRAMIAENPAEPRPHMALASIFSQAKDYRSAATVLEEARAAVPPTHEDFWNLHYQTGIAHERLKEWDKAEPAFRAALELRPDDADILNYLGYSLIDRNEKLDEALDMVRKAVNLEPDNGYIIDSLGWAYFRLGRMEEAIVELERAIAIMPGDPVINDHMGDAYWAVGRKLEARFMWNHALAGEPEPEEAIKIRAKIDEALRQEEAAKAEHLAAFKAANPDFGAPGADGGGATAANPDKQG
ncbi:MAG: tetratricopeptide repeat protein [Rhizobiaceae bacterium]|nr:tetratricopeptide repeat protein [Rhizobiaceae bacterium]